MPKKRTYEQLERALKRAKAVSKRTKRAYDSYLINEGARANGWRDTIDQLKQRHRREGAAREDRAADRVAETEAKNDELKARVAGETFRADNLLAETDELNQLLRDTQQCASSHRAEAAELNLIYFRKALEASNTVSLGLLDLAKLAATPALFTSPEGE